MARYPSNSRYTPFKAENRESPMIDPVISSKGMQYVNSSIKNFAFAFMLSTNYGSRENRFLADPGFNPNGGTGITVSSYTLLDAEIRIRSAK